VKIGDLVKWTGRDAAGVRPDTGIVVDGPRDSYSTSYGAWRTTYSVAWFDAKETFWHTDDNLEVISEYR